MNVHYSCKSGADVNCVKIDYRINNEIDGTVVK